MNLDIQWNEGYEIGVGVIDKEHKRLFRIMNRLSGFREEDRENERAFREGLKFFKEHALSHFEEEEAYMQSIGYPDLHHHQRIHRSFREHTLPAMEQELKRTGYTMDSIDHFLGVCAGWLIGHTLTDDQLIGKEKRNRWTQLLPHEEILALRKIIGQLMFDSFHLEPQLISDAYAGEKFGSGIYFRFVYGKPGEDKKQEVFLAVEEKFAVNTVGKILGLKSGKLDKRLIHAARHVARNFVSATNEYLPEVADYDLLGDDLLSYDQFKSFFEKGKMQVSMLFNTGGYGYFSYSIAAPHLLENGVKEDESEDAAVKEVEAFFEERTANRKRKQHKVLVVDDSLTMLHGIKDLLDTDYDVSLADSGLAAIRAMTLNLPDLVLLDYDMPVCDGRQTLQMLRADRTFADIPVIFLTGRGDAESVRQVQSLKPQGYLLKAMKPEAIKQKIDHFFEKKNAAG